jgi:L,D-transpeptidase ErfK/SrfK
MPAKLLCALALLCADATGTRAETPELPEVRGHERKAFLDQGETLLDVAYRNRVGFEAVSRLNPGLDPWIPEPGTVVRLPGRYLPPEAEPEGLVINVPEMRLYDYTRGPEPEIYAVAVGDPEDPTPIGDFVVGQKRIDPAWNVPESIREEKPELPAVVPPGPDNPLGSRWLTIGSSSYGIHGTNVRWSIGRLATHGCVRLYEEDVLELYERVPEGTRLQIVYQPFKWGREGGRLVLEAHPDLYGQVPDRLAAALSALGAQGLLDALDLARVWRVVEEARGEPVDVGR